MEILPLVSRWAHIASMSFLAGGAFFGHLAWRPAFGKLAEADQAKLGDRVAQALRPWVFTAIAVLLGSGLYNFLHKGIYPRGYHMWFGIKMLLALHIIAVYVLLVRTGVPPAKRKRWLDGIALSALLVIALSAVLRFS